MQFLMKAMSEVKEDKPFRGPNSHKEEDYKYTCEVEGDINFFNGIEKIFYNGKIVHILHFHGELL